MPFMAAAMSRAAVPFRSLGEASGRSRFWMTRSRSSSVSLLMVFSFAVCGQPVVPVLLLVVLDDIGRPDLRLIGIAAELAQRPSLPQQIPALIELHAQRLEPRVRLVVAFLLGVQLVLLVHELLDPVEHPFIRLMFRHSISSCARAPP